MNRKPRIFGRAMLSIVIAGAVIAAATIVGIGHLTPDAIASQIGELRDPRNAAPWLFDLAFLAIHITCAGLSLPLNVPIAVAAGAIFGLWPGLLITSFGAAAGSTLSMLSSRFLFRAIVQSRYGQFLALVEQGLADHGGSYLLSLRLMPAVPYTVVNLLFGLTSFPMWRFWLISQVGMLPGKFIFVQAGTSLENVHSFADILSPMLLASLGGLALLPLVGRFVSRLRSV